MKYKSSVNSCLTDTSLLRTPRYYGHLAITDTPLLRTLGKSQAKPITNYIAAALAITDSRYYGIADTSCGPQQTFLLFHSRYNGLPWKYFSLNTT